jgi:hypothetical protein
VANPQLWRGDIALAIMRRMLRYTRLFTDEQGLARFDDVDVLLHPDNPSPDTLSVSEPMPATAVLLRTSSGRGQASRATRIPPSVDDLSVGLRRITASGETRVFRPGDVLLVEDVDRVGHSSSTSEGFTVVAVVL